MRPLLLLAVLLSVDAAPAPGEEARRHMMRGRAAMKTAAGPADFAVAAGEFEAAAKADPKLVEARYNAGVAHEKAGDAASALAQFRAYLAVAPKAKDAKAVQDRVYELEFVAEKAADAAGCWRAEDFRPEPLVNIDENWCEFVVSRRADGGHDVKPFEAVHEQSHDGRSEFEEFVASGQRSEGRRLRFTIASKLVAMGKTTMTSSGEFDLTLTPDGRSLKGTVRRVSSMGRERDKVWPVVYFRRPEAK